MLADVEIAADNMASREQSGHEPDGALVRARANFAAMEVRTVTTLP